MDDLFSDNFSTFKYSKKSNIPPPDSFSLNNISKSFAVLNESIKTSNEKKDTVSALPFVKKVENTNHLKFKILDILGFKKKNGEFISNLLSRLPGPLPVTLNRKKLVNFQKSVYWVTEKSDGERCLMYITKEKTYLINRSFDFFEIQCDFYSKFLFTTGETIIDGEIIFKNLENQINKKNANVDLRYDFLKNKVIFLLFDIVLKDGEKVHNLNLNQRFIEIGKFNLNYRQKTSNPHPLAILAKTFYKASKISELLSQIKISENGQRLFCDFRRGVFNANDGFIFTPENEPFLQPQKRLFKWKWPQMNTFDFKVKKPYFKKSDFIELYSKLQNMDVFVKKIGPFCEEDRRILKGEMEKSDKNFCIVECGIKFDALHRKVWEIVKVRVDRDIPNYYTTILRTLEVICDNVTLDEIKIILK